MEYYVWGGYMVKKYFDMAQMFKALSDENRIRIIEMLQAGEMCAANILDELDVTQPTLSHHMKTLCESGMVECRKSGKWMYYKISESGCGAIMKWLGEIAKAEGAAPEISLEKVAVQRTKDLLASRTAPKKKTNTAKKTTVKKTTADNTAKRTEETEKEQRRLRDVDIVIL